MGRDDARPIAGLQGGTAPARAFHDFMISAVARRPVEQFETEVPMPDWQLEPEEEAWGLPPEENGVAPLVDADGNPLPVDPGSGQPLGQSGLPGAIRPDGTGVEGQWPEEIMKRGSERGSAQQPQQSPPLVPRTPPPRQPQPRSVPAPDPLQPRPDGAQ
jgi:penicillin-binding protein 1A